MASDTPTTETPAPAPAVDKPPSLWKNRDFLKLWLGYTTSQLGSQITVVAMPLVAIVILSANEAEVGTLGAVSRLPFLLFLFAGFWADRFRKRPTMIAADVGRALLLFLIVVMYLTGTLTLFWLGTITFFSVSMFVFFEVANMSHLPFLVGREHLGDGNAKLQLSNSVSRIAGNSIGSALVSVFAAALVLVVDVVTFLVSAVSCALIRKPEPEPSSEGDRPSVFSSIAEGLRWVWRDRLIRPSVLAAGCYMFFYTGIEVLLPLWMVEGLGLSPYWLGILLAVGGPGAILGSLLATRSMKWIGIGPAFFWPTVVGNLSLFLVALATGPTWLLLVMIGATQFLLGITGPIAMVASATLRMGATPQQLQGRVMASQRAVALSLAPLGALLTGLLAAGIGMRATLLICAAGAVVPIFVLALSPVLKTKGMPEPQEH
ncbi:Predicted arabinose efflux permease, MFS family [Nonomuraea maritima]|uniref:Predicted arabinose efflux permease, MFS family n=1 Tax=Nonomuraea maritima TaxID=683260 RepID=A0A1G9GZJ1_9ACTN|nr:MFS transporter [Nonomuraea maritima]SDL06025.1 Predicted arabinose efflux permease, MFS family [Nonomuraea maritima]